MQNRRLFLLAFLLLIATVHPKATSAQSHSGGGAEEVMRADEKFNHAVATQDRELFASMIDADATFLGGGLTEGREAIVSAWDGFFAKERSTFLSWKPYSVEMAASGDLAYTLGTFELRTMGADGAEKLSTGTYVSIWKKHKDGSWKVVVDGGTPPKPVALEEMD